MESRRVVEIERTILMEREAVGCKRRNSVYRRYSQLFLTSQHQNMICCLHSSSCSSSWSSFAISLTLRSTYDEIMILVVVER
jgi:hypothetical protein